MNEDETIEYIALLKSRRLEPLSRHEERLLVHELDVDNPAKRAIEERFMFTYGVIAAEQALEYYKREAARGITLSQAVYAANVALMVAAVRYKRRFSTIRFSLYVKATVNVVFDQLSATLPAKGAKNRRFQD